MHALIKSWSGPSISGQETDSSGLPVHGFAAATFQTFHGCENATAFVLLLWVDCEVLSKLSPVLMFMRSKQAIYSISSIYLSSVAPTYLYLRSITQHLPIPIFTFLDWREPVALSLCVLSWLYILGQ